MILLYQAAAVLRCRSLPEGALFESMVRRAQRRLFVTPVMVENSDSLKRGSNCTSKCICAMHVNIRQYINCIKIIGKISFLCVNYVISADGDIWYDIIAR